MLFPLSSRLHRVEHFPDLRPACGYLGLVFRCCALGGKAAFLCLALLAQDQFLLVPAPGYRNPQSQLRDELAGDRTPDQTAQVRDRARVHRFRLQARAQFVEQRLGLIRAALDQEERRGSFFREQSLGKDQITTTVRSVFIATRVAHV
jgi:hypothetical protein